MRRAFLLARRRLVSSIPVLLIVIVGTFFLLEAAPGDAVDAYLLSIGGGDPALVQSLRESYGLDQSVFARLWLYVTALAAARPRLVGGVRAADPRRHPRAPAQHAVADGQRRRAVLRAGLRARHRRRRAAGQRRRPRALDRLARALRRAELLARPGAQRRLRGAAALVPDRGHRDDRLGQAGPCTRARHRPASGAAGRRARLHLSRAVPAHDARRHGRSLAAGFRARRPRQGARRGGASCCATSRAMRCCRSSPCSACRLRPCSAAASSSRASSPSRASAGWRRRRSPAATRRS